MIDVPVSNEPMMWLAGGLALAEVNISQKQKVDVRSVEDGSDD